MITSALILIVVITCLTIACEVFDWQPFWTRSIDPEQPDEQDNHVAFRGIFTVAGRAPQQIRLLGTGSYLVSIDGDRILDGPARFPKSHPEYDTVEVTLAPGKHVIAVHVYDPQIDTRLMVAMPAFLACQVIQDGKMVDVEWKWQKLSGFQPKLRRLLGSFGWSEWCDTRLNPIGWMSLDFDDSEWAAVVERSCELGEFRPLMTDPVKLLPLSLEPVAQGQTCEMYGYETDDPPFRFFLRDLEPSLLPADGVWRRYDLDRVRLGRPRFVLDLPVGAVVEFGYTEMMRHDRVCPILWLGGQACYMDHYVARGGVQEFLPVWPKGLRYMEVHIKADSAKVKFLEEEFLERCYYDEPEGAFQCDDELLNAVWEAGAKTYRACSEDAITDCPTRERGQWTGDIVNAEMQIGAVTYSDLRLVKRSLYQAAWCARSDGLIAGMTPGHEAFLPTYSLHWVNAVLWYFEHTGDRSVLEDLLPYALKNFKAFEKHLKPEGLSDGLGWIFIDWGYVGNEGSCDMAYTLFFIEAIRSMQQWLKLLGKETEVAAYQRMEQDMVQVVQHYLRDTLSRGGWSAVGYHRSILALRAGLVDPDQVPACIASCKAHILNCFPNKPDAPRLSAPEVACPQLITPYFASFAFPPLIENGEMDFVLDQYRQCWGWGLSLGITTSLEVFDTRWSQCHAWAGCPTWQLSRYALGLWPRFDLGERTFELRLLPGSLNRASGVIPVPDSTPVQVTWQREGDHIVYDFEHANGITLLSPSGVKLNGQKKRIQLSHSERGWSI